MLTLCWFANTFFSHVALYTCRSCMCWGLYVDSVLILSWLWMGSLSWFCVDSLLTLNGLAVLTLGFSYMASLTQTTHEPHTHDLHVFNATCEKRCLRINTCAGLYVDSVLIRKHLFSHVALYTCRPCVCGRVCVEDSMLTLCWFCVDFVLTLNGLSVLRTLSWFCVDSEWALNGLSELTLCWLCVDFVLTLCELRMGSLILCWLRMGSLCWL